MSSNTENRGKKRLGAGSTSANGRVQEGRVAEGAEPEAKTEVLTLEPHATAEMPVVAAPVATKTLLRQEESETELEAVDAQGAKRQSRLMGRAEARWEKRSAENDSIREIHSGMGRFKAAEKASRPLTAKQQTKRAQNAALSAPAEQKTLQTRAESGDLDEKGELRLMQLNIAEANEKYLRSLEDSDLFVEGFTQEKQEETLGMHQKLYVKGMVLAGVAPLARGVNVRSVAQSLGMMTAMMLLSKDYREEVGSYFQPLKDNLEQKKEQRVMTKGRKAGYMVDTHNRLVDEKTQRMVEADPSLAGNEEFLQERAGLRKERGDYLSRKWGKRLHDLEFAQRGHREPYTAETAAMTEMGITRNAYARLRAPGLGMEDRQKIYRSYQGMVKKLRDDAISVDGLDGAEINRAQKLMLGKALREDPVAAAMPYNGLSYGRYEPGAEVSERIDGTDRVRQVWRGDFNDHRGNPVPDDLMFTLRAPEGRLQHENQIAVVMGEHMEHTLATKGLEDYTNEDLSGYMMGWKLYERNRLGIEEGAPLDFEYDDLPRNIQMQVTQSQMMIGTMAADGLSFQEQRLAYSNAFVDAFTTMRDKHPEMAVEWDKNYGKAWEERMKDAVDDPGKYLAEERDAQFAFVGGEKGLEKRRVFPQGKVAEIDEVQAEPQSEPESELQPGS